MKAIRRLRRNSSVLTTCGIFHFHWWIQCCFNKRLPFSLSKVYLTQNTRLTRLATHVNRTKNRTNRGLIRVTLWSFECIRERCVWFLKPLTIWYGCHVRVWSYKRSYKTFRERVRSYIQSYMKSTPRVCTYVFKRSPHDQYGLSTNHTWSSTCTTEYTVWKPWAQPCFVYDMLCFLRTSLFLRFIELTTTDV